MHRLHAVCYDVPGHGDHRLSHGEKETGCGGGHAGRREERAMKKLMQGNEAIAEAAIRAGCEAYFGYPITPQTEVLEYMSRRMPEVGRVFVQADSELGAINMVYGA